MEPMVTIPISTYNGLIDKALNGKGIDLKKVIEKIREVYRNEETDREFGQYHPTITVENACNHLIELIDKSNGDIPQAVKEWTNNISSKKSNP